MTLTESIEQASLWKVEAYPVIKAYLLAVEARDVLAGASTITGQYLAHSFLRQAYAHIEELREQAIEHNSGIFLDTMTDEQWREAEAFSEELNRSVPTVIDAIREVESEG